MSSPFEKNYHYKNVNGKVKNVSCCILFNERSFDGGKNYGIDFGKWWRNCQGK